MLIAWLAVRWREWRRIPDAERPPLEERLRTALRAEWPLLAILLLPAVLWLLIEVSSTTLLILLGGIALWWLADAVGYTVSGVSLTRDPLVCAIAAVRRLARSPWFVAVLLVAWLGSWATGVYQMRVWEAQTTGQAIAAGPSDRPIDSPTVEDAMHETMMSLVYQLPSYGWPLQQGTYTLVLILAAVVLFARIRLGAKPEERERAAWPLRLTVLMLLISAVPLLWWFQGKSAVFLDVWPTSLWWLVSSLGFLWEAPYVALVWHVLRQVVAGERWDLERAVRHAVNNWVPMIGLLFVVLLPALLLSHLPALVKSLAPQAFVGPSIGFALSGQISAAYSVVMPLFTLALTLAPWLIVDERSAVREALRRSWALALDNASDLLAFTLRYLLLLGSAEFLMTVLWVGRSPGYSPLNAIGGISRSAAGFIGVLAVGVLYQHLRDTRTEMTEAP
ncbi:MAG: hypothetical protein ACQER1_18265 [Armatimonadota bacterium]